MLREAVRRTAAESNAAEARGDNGFGEVKPGILYTTFHFPEHLVNVVTSSECDEDTMCPEYKVVAVDVERIGAAAETSTAQPQTAAVS